jgi:hypothetical protein
VATRIVINMDEVHRSLDLPTVPVIIQGNEFTAHYPKDTVELMQARLNERINDGDTSATVELLHSTLLSMFAREVADDLLERMLDMTNREVGLAYVMDLLHRIKNHYMENHGEEINAYRRELGLAVPEEEKKAVAKPQDRLPARRAPRKKAVTARQ